ncbi:MAG: hypothetical protein AB7N65_18495 [Vicinamibacterales bacterium]
MASSTASARNRVGIGLVLALAAGLLPSALSGLRSTAIVHLMDARLGRASLAIVAPRFVRDTLLAGAGPAGATAAPLIVVDGAMTGEGDEPASWTPVVVYGVDERFWRLHGVASLSGPAAGEVMVGQQLAARLAAAAGRRFTIAIPWPEDAPAASTHGRPTPPLRRLTATLAPERLGGLDALAPLETLRERPAVFVSLSWLQQAEAWTGRANAFLIAGEEMADAAAHAVEATSDTDGLGLTVREIPELAAVVVESRSGILDETTADAVTKAAFSTGSLPTAVQTVLVDAITLGDRTVPYSFVSSLELQAIAPDVHAEELALPPILLNAWTAARLDARVGAVVTLEYPVWRSSGRIEREVGRFEVAGIVPLAGAAAQREWTPRLPGISGATSLRAWTPRVAFDPSRVQPADEEYWQAYGPTPKAFVPSQVGRAIWRTPAGTATSIRVPPKPGVTLAETRKQLESTLLAQLTPAAAGIHVRNLRSEARSRARLESQAVRIRLPFIVPGVFSALVFAGIGWLTRRVAWLCAITATVLPLALAGRTMTASEGIPSATGGYDGAVETVAPMDGDMRAGWVAPPSAVSADENRGIALFRLHDGASTAATFTGGAAGLRIVAVDDDFIDEARFQFRHSLDRSDDERSNPWLLLRREVRDPSDPSAGPPTPVLPVVTSEGTLTRLALQLGDDIRVEVLGQPLRMRVVATLAPSLFGDAVVMHDSAFLQWFPGSAGYRWLAVDDPTSEALAPDLASRRLAPLAPTVIAARDTAGTVLRADDHRRRFERGWLGGALGLALGAVALVLRRTD